MTAINLKKPILELESLQFKLPNGRVILNQINASVTQGQWIILTGENGSGKSTLMKILNRQYKPSEGKIYLDHQNLQQINPKLLSQKIITLTQFVKDSLFLQLSVFENACLIANFKKMPTESSRQEALKIYLASFNPHLASLIDQRVASLSGGEQQQIAFALYLTHQPSLLLLDEHTSALDPKAAQQVMAMTERYIRENQITCLMTTHQTQFANTFGDVIWRMQDGRLEELA